MVSTSPQAGPFDVFTGGVADPTFQDVGFLAPTQFRGIPPGQNLVLTPAGQPVEDGVLTMDGAPFQAGQTSTVAAFDTPGGLGAARRGKTATCFYGRCSTARWCSPTTLPKGAEPGPSSTQSSR